MVGRSGAGKSTFMQCALDLKYPGTSSISSKKVSLEGSISIVRLVELDLEDISIGGDSIRWPESVQGFTLPAIDGVLLLYDVVDRSSVETIPDLLRMSIRTVSLSAKLQIRIS